MNETEIKIRHILKLYIANMNSQKPSSNITGLRVQVKALHKTLAELQEVKEEIKQLEDIAVIVELGTLTDNLITDFDSLRIKYEADYEKRQRTNPIRSAEAFLEFVYPQISEKMPELIDATLIEVVGDKYNWTESQTLLCNLIMMKGGSFDKRIIDYFLVRGKSINPDSLASKYKAKTIAKSFNRLREVFPNNELPYWVTQEGNK